MNFPNLPLLIALILIANVNHSYAGLWDVNNENECIKKYLPKAQLEEVASVYRVACKGKFAYKPYKIATIKLSDNRLVEIPSDMPKEELIEVLRTSGFSNVHNYSVVMLENDNDYKVRLNNWLKQKSWADCVLRSKEILNSKTKTSFYQFITECTNM